MFSYYLARKNAVSRPTPMEIFTLTKHTKATFPVVAVAFALLMPSVGGSTSPKTMQSSASAKLFPLSSVRLLKGPFTTAVEANRKYLLALDPDRLLAPFRREAGLEPRKPSYENWENIGLDGHTAGHYLAALADMVAAGDDTKDGELRRRLDYMVNELALCQKASPDGYVGGIPGSRAFWKEVAAGHIEAFNGKWVPWYNLHKTYAGLRDAYLVAGNKKAREVLVGMGDWAAGITANLSDEQMQRMLGYEHGGMNEVFADIYAITGDSKYLTLAKRFSHQAILQPLESQEDKLTGLHANTQIPKIMGFERIATLTGDKPEDAAARFFWDEVTRKRSVAFGGNSVSEHFNDPKDFQGLLEHREGPETCNTYNMLRLTEQLFSSQPSAGYADYYERSLYNHILASINPEHPGYVYFTPIRPGHYRVYSQPGQGFWCCVGTGMENPGRYGQFIYAKAQDGLYVNLFIASQLSVPESGLTLRQETAFPDEERTRLTLSVKRPTTMTLHLRHPAWVADGALVVRVNGKRVAVKSTPSSYAAIRREWKDGDRVEVELPMRTTVEGLPDGSNWYAILHGPIVLASPTSAKDLVGLRAGAGRGDHIAHGPLIPMDQMPVVVSNPADLPKHIVRDPAAGPLRFRLADVSVPASKQGLPLEPFFRLHDSRYQMYWEVTTKEGLAARQERLAEAERAKLARDVATIDSVAIGEQQPEVDHALTGEGMESGEFNGRRWRHGRWFQYVLNSRGVKAVDLEVTYSGGDAGRTFGVYANGVLLATEALHAEKPGEFVERRYTLSPEILAQGQVVIKFSAPSGLAGGVYDVRLLKR
ncbi:glycosyl hydrolase [bacterium]|nr:MAG: glycosyl hydrolase [bacterium]